MSARVKFWVRWRIWQRLRRFFAWVGRGFKPEPSPVFKDVKELCETVYWTWPDDGEIVTIDEIEKATSHRVYKYTSCGAWLAFIKSPPEEQEPREFSVELSQERGPLGVVQIHEVLHGWMKDPLPETQWPTELKRYLALEPFPGYSFSSDSPPLGGSRIENLFVADDPNANRDSFFGDWHVWRPQKDNPDRGFLEVHVRCQKPCLEEPPFGVFGIRIGSIVEGCDGEVQPEELYFPFTEEDLKKAVANVEAGADEIWKQTHGCAHCWTEGTKCPEEGDCPQCDDPKGTPGDGSVDPDCKSCGGDGVVI